MASKFGVKQLMEDTGRLFSKILPEDPLFHTQISLYEYAEETQDFVLQENCMQYLAWNYQNLTTSPAWTRLSTEFLGALLSRSDLVVPDEYFLLQTVESWIAEMGNSTSLDAQVDLLSRIRFPMIPAEKVYGLESNSSLYDTHKNVYRENMFKAFQFNVLLLGNLQSNPKFNIQDDDYKPRIYTAEPWSAAVPDLTHYNSYEHAMTYSHDYSYLHLYTPVHHSLIFKANTIQWAANIFKSQYECSNRGLSCESFPAARLVPQNNFPQSNIVFRNRLVLMCQNKYICQVQDFKDNIANIGVDGVHVLAYPCPDDKYTYRFVVRPEYV